MSNSASSMPPLAGSTTGAAKEINHRLKRIDIPAKPTRFLRHLEDLTFGNAGFHRQWKHEDPGTWCNFDFAAWRNDLEMSKSTLHNVIARLLEEKIIWFEADPTIPGRGRIGWNLNYDEWQPRPSWGGKRANAGLKASNSSILISDTSERANLNTGEENIIKMERMVVGNQFKMVRSPATNIIKMEHSAASVADAETAGALPRMGTEELSTKEQDVLAADAAQGILLSVPVASKQPELQAAIDSKKERPRDELWDAAVHIFGFSPEGSAAGLWGKKLSLMRKRSVPVVPDELITLAAAYQRKYPTATFSLAAVEAHIDDLRVFIKKEAPHGKPQQNSERHVPDATSARRFLVKLPKPAGA